MKTDETKVESLPAGVVVMMLEGLKQANKQQQIIIYLLMAGWLSTMICFAIWCMPVLAKG